ncbi:MAG: hypothetical protein AAFQ98_16615, partial [Bacteroidota bacterium]
RLIRSINTELDTDKAQQKETFGSDWDPLLKTLEGLEDHANYSTFLSGKAEEQYREQVMRRNFKAHVAPEDIIYAQFGAGHIALTPVPYFTGFMSLLQEDPLFANRTLSMQLKCMGCRLGSDPKNSARFIPMEDGMGYTWFDSMFDMYTREEIRFQFLESLAGESTAIDLRTGVQALQITRLPYQYYIVQF